MSDNELHKGTITRIFPQALDIEEQCKRILGLKGITDIREHSDTYAEAFSDQCFDDYCIINDNVYSKDNTELDPTYGPYEASGDIDGTIKYVVGFYNGGSFLDEAIEQAVNNMTNSE